MRQPLLDAVRGLDPAAGLADGDATAMLARIRSQARGDTATDSDVARLVPRTRSRPAHRIALGAAALSALTVLALVLTLTQRGPQAYASWQAEPTVLAEIPVSMPCPDVEPGPPPTPVEPVLSEQRGSYTFTVLAGEGVFVECLVSTADDGFAMAQGTAPADPAALQLGDAPVVVLDPGGTWGQEAGEGPITTIVGLADDSVTEVRVSTSGGLEASAAVADGWWTVWFPGEVEVADEIVVVTEAGERVLGLDDITPAGL